jgi:hypothetical protein
MAGFLACAVIRGWFLRVPAGRRGRRETSQHPGRHVPPAGRLLSGGRVRGRGFWRMAVIIGVRGTARSGRFLRPGRGGQFSRCPRTGSGHPAATRCGSPAGRFRGLTAPAEPPHPGRPGRRGRRGVSPGPHRRQLGPPARRRRRRRLVLGELGQRHRAWPGHRFRDKGQPPVVGLSRSRPRRSRRSRPHLTRPRSRPRRVRPWRPSRLRRPSRLARPHRPSLALRTPPGRQTTIGPRRLQPRHLELHQTLRPAQRRKHRRHLGRRSGPLRADLPLNRAAHPPDKCHNLAWAKAAPRRNREAVEVIADKLLGRGVHAQIISRNTQLDEPAGPGKWRDDPIKRQKGRSRYCTGAVLMAGRPPCGRPTATGPSPDGLRPAASRPEPNQN